MSGTLAMERVETIIDLLDGVAERFSARAAIRHGNDEVSFEDMRDRVLATARGLEARGVTRGDRVMIFVPNEPAYLYAYFALLRLGAIAVPLNLALSTDESLSIARKVEPSMILATAATADKVSAIAPALSGAPPVLFVDGEAGEELRSSSGPVSELPPPPSPADIASCHFTSGTTGDPKGILLSHSNFISNVKSLQATRDWEPGEHVFGNPIPLFHGYSTTILMLFPLSIGATVVLFPGFSAARYLSLIQKGGVTTFGGVTSMFAMFNKVRRPERYDLSGCRYFICGGAPLPLSILETFEERFDTTICEGYGLIETSPVVTLNPFDKSRKPGSIGPAIRDVIVKLVDEEGNEVPPGASGELIVTGPNIMQGYFRDEERTREVIRDGWFYTGDIGRVDVDGFFTIEGRVKEMIIVAGENVYPQEIDQVLLEHSGIADAAAAGVPDPIRGERIKAFIVANAGAELTREGILAHCKEKLAAYKVPKEIEFVDTIPRNATGKILRRELVKEG